MGSPPRVREKPLPDIKTLARNGITPACAGKTIFYEMEMRESWDHPRVCGKNMLWLLIVFLIMGSPPRVREKLEKLEARAAMAGITPACAGKTPHLNNALLLCQDHPRVCGKNISLSSPRIFSVGSPPRVREKLTGIDATQVTTRITPACAGKTRNLKPSRLRTWDHPRVCGKNSIDYIAS